MRRPQNTFRRAEQDFGEVLSALRGIILQTVEFVIFVCGLLYIAHSVIK